MNRIARNWRVVIGGVAAGSAAVIGFAGASASAEPVPPAPVPAPVTVTQTVTVTPEADAPPRPRSGHRGGTCSPAPPAAPAAAASAAPAAVAAAPARPTAATPATSGTITEFLKDKGVTLEPQKAAGFTALNIVLPVPPAGAWSPTRTSPTRSA